MVGQEDIIEKDIEYKQIDVNAKINQQGQPEFFSHSPLASISPFRYCNCTIAFLKVTIYHPKNFTYILRKVM
jgi:hypothetical protein